MRKAPLTSLARGDVEGEGFGDGVEVGVGVRPLGKMPHRLARGREWTSADRLPAPDRRAPAHPDQAIGLFGIGVEAVGRGEIPRRAAISASLGGIQIPKKNTVLRIG